MTHDVLTRLRDGLASKRFTLTAVARAADIPLTTLDHMRKEGYGDRLDETLARLTALKAALDKIEPADTAPVGSE